MFAVTRADEESKPDGARIGHQGRKERRDYPLLSGRPADDGQQLRIKSQCPQRYFPADAPVDGFAAGANQPAVGQSATVGAVAEAIVRAAYLVRAIVVPSQSSPA